MIRSLWLTPYLLGCAAIFSVSNMERPPVPDALSFRFADKLLHAIAYGGLAAFALVGVLGLVGFSGAARGRAAAIAVAMTSIYGALDEVHQAFVPGRSATVGDWVADTLGALILVGLWLRSRRFPRPDETRSA